MESNLRQTRISDNKSYRENSPFDKIAKFTHSIKSKYFENSVRLCSLIASKVQVEKKVTKMKKLSVKLLMTESRQCGQWVLLIQVLSIAPKNVEQLFMSQNK